MRVDRLWPRGLRRDSEQFHRWLKEVAPSTELRRWYGHQEERLAEFSNRYRGELGTGDAAAGLRGRRATTRTAQELSHGIAWKQPAPAPAASLWRA